MTQKERDEDHQNSSNTTNSSNGQKGLMVDLEMDEDQGHVVKIHHDHIATTPTTTLPQVSSTSTTIAINQEASSPSIISPPSSTTIIHPQQQQHVSQLPLVPSAVSVICSSNSTLGSAKTIVGGALSIISDFDDNNYKALKTVKLAHDLQYAEHKKRKKNLMEKKYIWLLLTIASVFGGIIAYVHDLILRYMYQGRITIVEQIDSSLFGVRLLVWIVYNLFFIVITLLMVVLIAPSAEGSGVSHIKAILNGAELKDAMSLQTFFVKLFTVALVVGSQMVLGKMGPTIHICTIFILYLMKLKIFKPIEKSRRLRQQLILCGVSIGVGAAFATPCGAVLFAVELVGGYYSMRTYFKAFYVAAVSAVVSRTLNSIITLNIDYESYWDIQIVNPSYTAIEILLFALLGVMIGVMGIVFVQINIFLMNLKDKIGSLVLWMDLTSKLTSKQRIFKIFENKILLTLVFSVLTSVLSYPELFGKFASLSYGNIFKDLMSTNNLSFENNWFTNSPTEIFESLFILLATKFFLIIFTIVLPIPGGSYNGIILLGTIVGRIMGEIIAILVPNGFPYLLGIYETQKQQLIQPGAYAFVGGVASAACVTQSYSVVVIFLEMAGGGAHIPSLISSVIALSITKYFSLGMYNIVIDLRGWNVMLEQQTDSDELKLVTIMKPFDEMEIILEEEVSFEVMEFLMDKLKDSTITTDIIPIINNRKDMILLGRVSKNSLIEQYMKKKEIVERNEIFETQQETTDKKQDFNNQKRSLLIDYHSCDVILSESNDVHTAHQILYQNTHLDSLFVCWKGKLLGVVERRAVKSAILSKKQKKELFIYHLY